MNSAKTPSQSLKHSGRKGAEETGDKMKPKSKKYLDPHIREITNKKIIETQMENENKKCVKGKLKSKIFA